MIQTSLVRMKLLCARKMARGMNSAKIQEQLRIFNIAGKNDPALPALFFLQLYAKAVGTVKGHFDPREKTCG